MKHDMPATLTRSIVDPIKTGYENRFVINVFLVHYRYNIDFIKTLLTFWTLPNYIIPIYQMLGIVNSVSRNTNLLYLSLLIVIVLFL